MAPAPRHSYEEERALILDAAVQCIEQSSITDFTMSALSKAAGLSMGSVYKHIRTKEDLLVALAIESLDNMLRTFDAVLSLPLPFPIRLIALQMTDRRRVDYYEFGPQLDALVGSEAFLKRASTDWVEKLMDADIAVENCVQGALLQAVSDGELDLEGQAPEDVAEDIMVACWSMCTGFTQVARQRAVRQLVGKGVEQSYPLGIDDSIVRALKRLLSTYPWSQPVTDEALQEACNMLVEHNLR